MGQTCINKSVAVTQYVGIKLHKLPQIVGLLVTYSVSTSKLLIICERILKKATESQVAAVFVKV